MNLTIKIFWMMALSFMGCATPTVDVGEITIIVDEPYSVAGKD
jgi:hypothetical protein